MVHDSRTVDWTLCERSVKYCACISCSKLISFISAVLIFHKVLFQSVQIKHLLYFHHIKKCNSYFSIHKYLLFIYSICAALYSGLSTRVEKLVRNVHIMLVVLYDKSEFCNPNSRNFGSWQHIYVHDLSY